MDQNFDYGPVAFPVYLQVQSVGDNCNLECAYCNLRHDGTNHPEQEMSLDVLDLFIRQYIDAQIHADVTFYWRGGEPLLRGIDFYEKAVLLQRKYGKNRIVNNVIRTNGVILDQDWCDFFKANNFSIELVLDGPRHCHDHYRKKKDGTGSFDEMMLSLYLLRENKLPFNVIVRIHDYNVNYPLEIYSFLKENKFRNVHFSPVVNHKSGRLSTHSVTPDLYGSFLCSIFDEWIRHDIGRLNISLFEDTLRVFCRKEINNCMFSPTCGHFALTQFNGDVYSCYYYCKPDHCLGNLSNQTITGMMYSRKQLRFGQSKKSQLTSQCRKCEYLRLCNGGCPKDRFGLSQNGEKGHNILCGAFTKFFRHASPSMAFMAEEIAAGGNPSRIMSYFEI